MLILRILRILRMGLGLGLGRGRVRLTLTLTLATYVEYVKYLEYTFFGSFSCHFIIFRVSVSVNNSPSPECVFNVFYMFRV